jgi:hypothetical protein
MQSKSCHNTRIAIPKTPSCSTKRTDAHGKRILSLDAKTCNFSPASVIFITFKLQRIIALHFQHYLLYIQCTQGQQTRQSPYVISRATNLILPLDQYSGGPASSRGNPIQGSKITINPTRPLQILIQGSAKVIFCEKLAYSYCVS